MMWSFTDAELFVRLTPILVIVASVWLTFIGTVPPTLGGAVSEQSDEPSAKPSLADVLSRLEAREKLLRNLTVRLAEGGYYRDPDQPNRGRNVKPGSKDSMVVTTWLKDGKRAGSMQWEPGGVPAINHDGHFAWVPGDDTYKAISPEHGQADKWIGSVQLGQPEHGLTSPSGMRYFELLGLFRYNPKQVVDGRTTSIDDPLREWVAREAKSRPTHVDRSEWKGRPAILLRLGDHATRPKVVGEWAEVNEFYFDVERDFMPLASRWTVWRFPSQPAQSGAAKSAEWVSDVGVDESLRSKEVDGVWVPMELFTSTTHSEFPRREGNQRWIVQAISLDPPADERFDIQFPVGTTVIDMVHQVAYDIVADGEVRPATFMMSGASGISDSPPELVRKSLERFPPYEGFALKKLLPPASPVAAGGDAGNLYTSGWFWAALTAGLGVIVMGYFAIRASARSRSSASSAP